MIIQSLNDSNTAQALDFIVDMQQRAAENAEAAGEVRELLAGYKARLADGVGKLQNVSELIEGDSRTSKAKIDELSGSKDTLGSIANNIKLLQDSNDRYKQDVIKATTSLTYAWVFPYGTIAAISVAGVFGDQAVKEMKNLDEMTSRLKTKSDELNTALTTVQVQNIAKTGIDQALALTDKAIEHTTVLQNAWKELDGQLRNVLKLLNDSTTTVDEKKVLKNSVLVKNYIGKAGKTWSGVLPALRQLNAAPYISVKQQEVSIVKMADDVQIEIDRLKAIEKKNQDDLQGVLDDVNKDKNK
jgi:hypothetical protein